ncbi:MAG: hypothetical protein NZZ41_02050 [Candidatus Dojkabacteria bacterium]|nr:hypothetical protein [Candidatus Dojkabacteria bacterium]
MNYIKRTGKKYFDAFLFNLERFNKNSLYFEYRVSKEEAQSLIDDINKFIEEKEELKRKNTELLEKVAELSEKLNKKFEDSFEIKIKIDGEKF